MQLPRCLSVVSIPFEQRPDDGRQLDWVDQGCPDGETNQWQADLTIWEQAEQEVCTQQQPTIGTKAGAGTAGELERQSNLTC